MSPLIFQRSSSESEWPRISRRSHGCSGSGQSVASGAPAARGAQGVARGAQKAASDDDSEELQSACDEVRRLVSLQSSLRLRKKRRIRVADTQAQPLPNCDEKDAKAEPQDKKEQDEKHNKEEDKGEKEKDGTKGENENDGEKDIEGKGDKNCSKGDHRKDSHQISHQMAAAPEEGEDKEKE